MSVGPNAGDRAVGDALIGRIARLGRALQSVGVPVAGGQLIDATEAVREMDITDREQLRIALRATLVTAAEQVAAFERLFDRVFPPSVGAPVPPDGSPAAGGDLVSRLPEATDRELAQMAAGFVDEHGGMEGELRSERYHVRRVLRKIDLARLLSQAMARSADERPDADAFRDQVARLRDLVVLEVRSRIDEGRDAELDDLTALEDVDILRASRQELDQIRAAIRPLARRLATRVARRRRSRSGRADMRRTIRRSLATGGVPLEVSHRRPHVQRPELLVLADISGSVADFAAFTLTFVTSVSEELAATRSFAFVDAVDEITGLLRATDHTIEPWQLLRNARVIGEEGHSDYGAVLEQFWDLWGHTGVRSTSTVILLGDARSNNRPPGVEAFARLSGRAREVFWLNPEPHEDWDTGDSVIGQYAEHCTAVYEVRTLRQLVDSVEDIL